MAAMVARKTVRIDSLPESAFRYSGYDAIVCVDVLLSATTIVTAVAQGRRVLAAADAGDAAQVSAGVEDALLLTDALDSADDGMRFGGPAWLTSDAGPQAVVHVSPLARMLMASTPGATVYVACLRNLDATANELALRHKRVVLIGAGESGDVCMADQMSAAWLAVRLQRRHFELEGRNTSDEVARWGSSDVSLIGLSRSADRLRARGRGADVDFVLHHVDDVSVVCAYENGEIRDAIATRRRVQDDTETPAWGTPIPVVAHGH
jgi:phosphosulfolactate phosphohydrolase-like enzyme